MDLQRPRRARLRWTAAGLLAALGAALVPVPPARAAEPGRPTSLQWIPADAAFYSALLRNREQVQIVAHSKAWATLKALPAVQMAEKRIRAELQQPKIPQLAGLIQRLQQPENRQLGELLRDMVAEEIFCYGDETVLGFLELVQQLTITMRYGPALAQLRGEEAPSQGRMLLRALAAHRELLRVPDVVVGFRLSKAEPAQAQLKRLEKLLNDLVERFPDLKGRFKRVQLAGGDFLTLRLDGSLLPQEKLAAALKEREEKDGEFEELFKTLTHLKLTISLGLRQNYLLLSLGESDAGLTKLGGTKGLSDRPELQPLEAYAQQRLTSVAYASQALRARLGTSAQDFASLAELARAFLRKAEVPTEEREKIRKDLHGLANDLKRFLPRPGAVTAFTFLTDRGCEGFSYDWSHYPRLDGSKPLTLLNHVGGSPLLAVVTRHRFSISDYQLLVKWLKVADQYVTDVVVPRLDEEQREQFEKAAKVVRPALEKLNQITQEELLPALRGGQAAFVLDAKLRSRQWHKALPEAATPLPMLEPALVVQVSDAALLRRALADSRSTLNDLIARLHEQLPQLPDRPIPEPWTRPVKSGTLYGYPVPAEAGLNKQFAPNLGLADRVADLSLFAGQSERLLAGHALKVEGGPLADHKRPLARAVYCDWAGLIGAVGPWVEFGIRTALERRARGEGEGEGGDMPSPDAILKQVHTILSVLECLRTYSSATYRENNVWITHAETVFKDL